MSPNPEIGESNSSERKGKERSFDATRPDGGRRSSEEREPLDPLRHTESNPSTSEEVSRRQSKTDDRYIDKFSKYTDSLGDKPPNLKTLSRLHNEWEKINQSLAEPKSQVEEPSNIRELNNAHFSEKGKFDDYYIDRVTKYIKDLDKKEPNQEILDSFAAIWKDSQAKLQDTYYSQMRQLEEKPDILPKERGDSLDSSPPSGLISRSNSQKWLRGQFGGTQRENVDVVGSNFIDRKGKAKEIRNVEEGSRAIHGGDVKDKLEPEQGYFGTFASEHRDVRTPQEIIEAHIIGKLGNDSEAIALMSARGKEAANKLRASGNAQEAITLMKAIDIYASNIPASARGPSDVLQQPNKPRHASSRRQLKSLEQEYFGKVIHKEQEQHNAKKEALDQLKAQQEGERIKASGYSRLFTDLVLGREGPNDMFKRHQEEQNILKSGMEEKYQKELAELRAQHEKDKSELLAESNPPPAYSDER